MLDFLFGKRYLKKDNFKSKVFVVLGMHRSGTSLISKALYNEIHMGERLLKGKTKAHKYGHYEDEEFMQLNIKILKSAGGRALRDIPEEESILNQSDKYKNKIQELVEKNTKKHRFWGWKDPRTTLTIRLYLPYLINPHFVCVFRDPEEVVKNFHERDLIVNGKQTYSHEEIRIMVDTYNQRLISFISDFTSGKIKGTFDSFEV